MVSVDLFLVLIKPVELTSKQFTVQVIPVMSLTNGAYFFDFSTGFFFNVSCHWASKFKDVQLLLLWINYHNVWFHVGYTEVHWNGSTSCGFPPWQITENLEILCHIVHNEVYQIVVPPGISSCVQHGAATVQIVIGCSSVATKFASVRRGLLPSLEVGWCGKSVNACVQHKF